MDENELATIYGGDTRTTGRYLIGYRFPLSPRFALRCPCSLSQQSWQVAWQLPAFSSS
ncbi:MAG: hypothetical protein LBI43_05425 [Streptococcaceae bacterium]|nr:hypothetical protein [Streptococcaceae bacterium]